MGGYAGWVKWKVTLLRANGVRLKRSELATPVIGELVVAWMPESNFKRPVRKAELFDRSASVDRPLLLPLFKPVLVHMASELLVLQGVELSMQDGRVAELVQVWHCTPPDVDLLTWPGD